MYLLRVAILFYETVHALAPPGRASGGGARRGVSFGEILDVVVRHIHTSVSAESEEWDMAKIITTGNREQGEWKSEVNPCERIKAT